MNHKDPIETKDPLDDKIDSLTNKDLEKALELFRRKLNFYSAVYLNTCVHCGLCADSCHYYLADHDFRSLPAYKLNLVSGIFKKYYSRTGKMIPGLTGARVLDNALLKEWIDTLYGRCTMCGRCTINCSIGIHIPSLIRIARGILSAFELTPAGLDTTVRAALEKGNNMGVPLEEWTATVEWIQGEFQDEIHDETAQLPVDKKGARILYMLNPREPMLYPMTITAAAKIFRAAGEDWTFASDNFDMTNYALFAGDEAAGAKIAERLVQAMERLECKILVIAECGHGFNVNRWEAPEWLKTKYPFEVKSILEIMAQYIRDRKIKLDPSKNNRRVTLHDPCNLVRYGGIIEEQRYILKHAVTDFVEMHPNRQKNYCCSGGGGQLAMSRYKERRINAGKIKAEQIKKTAAKIVVAPCHNCIDQITELNKHYQLGIEIKTVTELVANALV